MQPRLSPRERDLFQAFAGRSARYLEFGTGGSTVVAAPLVRSWMISVDSSAEWLARVRDACPEAGDKLRLRHVDIGPTGEWGYPSDPASRPRWSRYHAAVWEMEETMDTDLCFIDGRFRVACFAQAVLHCAPGTIIGIHDFASRSQYQHVHSVGREIAAVDDLAFFVPRTGAHGRAAQLLENFAEDPS